MESTQKILTELVSESLWTKMQKNLASVTGQAIQIDGLMMPIEDHIRQKTQAGRIVINLAKKVQLNTMENFKNIMFMS